MYFPCIDGASELRRAGIFQFLSRHWDSDDELSNIELLT